MDTAWIRAPNLSTRIPIENTPLLERTKLTRYLFFQFLPRQKNLVIFQTVRLRKTDIKWLRVAVKAEWKWKRNFESDFQRFQFTGECGGSVSASMKQRAGLFWRFLIRFFLKLHETERLLHLASSPEVQWKQGREQKWREDIGIRTEAGVK